MGTGSGDLDSLLMVLFLVLGGSSSLLYLLLPGGEPGECHYTSLYSVPRVRVSPAPPEPAILSLLLSSYIIRQNK